MRKKERKKERKNNKISHSAFIENANFVFYTDRKEGIQIIWKEITNEDKEEEKEYNSDELFRIISERKKKHFELIITGDCLDYLIDNGVRKKQRKKERINCFV